MAEEIDAIAMESCITCPICGHREVEVMPADACQYFYDCRGCGEVLRPQPGDCCVFCSYGSVKCPPMQKAVCCGARADGAGRT